MKTSLNSKLNKALSRLRIIDDAESLLKKFGELRFVDEKIDDGIDDDGVDEYVMLRSYDLKCIDNTPYEKTEKHFYVRLFFGNKSGVVGYYELR